MRALNIARARRNDQLQRTNMMHSHNKRVADAEKIVEREKTAAGRLALLAELSLDAAVRTFQQRASCCRGIQKQLIAVSPERECRHGWKMLFHQRQISVDA